MDHRFYHTSQFAQKASVSVRTLRYYDKMGLLEPSEYTEAGYRLYSNYDLMRLQNILALKFLGFSLDEIRALLHSGPQDIKEILAQQKALMSEKRTQLDHVIDAIERAEDLVQKNGCDWDAIVRMIQVIQMAQDQKDWTDKYFTPEQKQVMNELSKKVYTEEASQRLKELHPGTWTEEDQKRVDEQYAFVKNELTRLVAINADPASPEAQKVAEVRHELRFGFSKGDALIEESLCKWWTEFHALPAEQRPFDMAMYTYTSEEQALLDKALEIYKQRLNG